MRRHARDSNFYIIHPYSNMQVVREILFFLCGTWEIIVGTLIATFGYVDRITPLVQVSPELEWFLYPDLLVLIIEICWILTNFFTGFKEKNSRQSIQLNHSKIIKRYISTFLLIDVMMIPLPVNEQLKKYHYIYFLNMISVLRCSTIISILKRFLLDFNLPEEIIICTVLFFVSFILMHIFACMFYFVSIITYDGQESLWLADVNLYPNQPLGMMYFGCFSIVLTHFWGLGETSIRSENNMEEIVLIVVMIVGRLWTLFVLAALLKVFTISSLSESKYEQYLMQLRTFISHNNLPKEMEERILEYYEYKYQHHFFNEKAIFGALSSYLKQELMLFRARNVINKVQIFKYFPRHLIAAIISKCRILVFMNNDYIVKIGDTIEDVFLISSGTAAGYNNRGFELIHLNDGDDIGTRAVVTTSRCTFNHAYISVQTTEIYAINIKVLRDIIYSKPDVLKFFQKKVEERSEVWRKIETIAMMQGVDLLSELKNEKLLERPRIRTRFFE